MVPDGSGRVRAVFPGDASRAAVSAPALRITVNPTVTITLSGTSVRRGRRIGITGTVGPTAPQTVRVLLERHAGGATVKVVDKRVRVRNGTFRTFVRPTLRGRYRLTVQALGTVKRRKLLAR